MKLWIATIAAAAAFAGCADTVAAKAGPRPSAPSDDEVRRAYENFLKRSICRGVPDCDEARVDMVSQVECPAAGRHGRIRCKFVVHVETPLPGRGHTSLSMNVHLHLCTGSFQRHRSGWRMLSLIGECPSHPADK